MPCRRLALTDSRYKENCYQPSGGFFYAYSPVCTLLKHIRLYQLAILYVRISQCQPLSNSVFDSRTAERELTLFADICFLTEEQSMPPSYQSPMHRPLRNSNSRCLCFLLQFFLMLLIQNVVQVKVLLYVL